MKYCPRCTKKRPTKKTKAANGCVIRCLVCGSVIESKLGGEHGKKDK